MKIIPLTRSIPSPKYHSSTMAPKITRFADMAFIAERFDPKTDEFLYTTFAVIEEDDSVYFGQVSKPKLQITLDEFTTALVRVPDAEIYPVFSPDGELTAAPDNDKPLSSDLYLKRTRLFSYGEYKEQDCVDIIPALVLEEAQMLEKLSDHPHPGIIRYHGCRVQRGVITGLVLDKHVGDLKTYLVHKKGPPLEKGAFMEALGSAIAHLHALGLAHNDVNPRNILVNSSGLPVLADFDSCRPVAEKLTFSRGTKGWIDETESYTTSETRHDIYGMEKVGAWLDEQTAGVV